jgi:hypothetical protein
VVAIKMTLTASTETHIDSAVVDAAEAETGGGAQAETHSTAQQYPVGEPVEPRRTWYGVEASRPIASCAVRRGSTASGDTAHIGGAALAEHHADLRPLAVHRQPRRRRRLDIFHYLTGCSKRARFTDNLLGRSIAATVLALLERETRHASDDRPAHVIEEQRGEIRRSFARCIARPGPASRWT